MAALPAASFQRNKCLSHLICGSLTPSIGIGILIAVMSSAVFVPLYLNVPRNNFFWNSANAIWVTDKQSSIPIQAIIWIDFPRNGFFVIYVIFAVNHNF